jgi:hypothetical protein
MDGGKGYLGKEDMFLEQEDNGGSTTIANFSYKLDHE